MPIPDASVVVDWVRPDADVNGPEQRLIRRIASSGADLHAPHLLIQEVANALLTGVRRGRWSASEADESFTTLDQLPIIRHTLNNDIERAWDLSRRYDEHPIYDMVYLAAAERLGTVFITSDQKLLNRVRHSGLVVSPDDWMAE